MIKAVIFDMDGLLIDSEPLWHQAQGEVFRRLGFTVDPTEHVLHQGQKTVDVVKFYQDKHSDYSHPTEIISEEIVDNVIRLITYNTGALPGVHQLIALLQKHAIPMAVASGSGRKLMDHVLKVLNIEQYMQVIHSAEHEKKGKPAPDVFLSTAELLKVDPVDCLVFEDSVNGVKAAHAAGMKCIAVPEHPHDPSRFTTANKIVHSLEEVDWEMIRSLL